ncbi:MAG: SufD family Fe-S cluster assembly protein [Candidatus Micrarchaeaceae archaeon]
MPTGRINYANKNYLEISYGNTKMIGMMQAATEMSGVYSIISVRRISATEVRDLPVYNFGVEEDESYVACGVAVHNCTAPIYMSSSLHSAVVELVAHKNSHIRYVTIQNWSKNVYNLVTQRAFAYENAHVEWIDGNIGSKLNMKYPSVFLKERGARGEIMSIAVAGPKQVQDSGGKIYHLAPDTTSQIISKSVSSGDGVTTYRGLLHIGKNASNVKSTVRCDALLLDEESKTNTYPYMEVNREDATITHEASTGKVGEEQLFYLMSRGLSEEDALTTVVLGFLDPLARALPLEYSLELRRLIKLDMSNSVG